MRSFFPCVVFFCSMAQIAYSNPKGPESAVPIKIEENLGRLQIRAPDGAVISWDAFSIAEGELTEFLLPHSRALVINQVIGSLASEIAGDLSSNGQVYLINPHGIWIGPQGRIDTAAFLASTLQGTWQNGEDRKERLFEGTSEQPIVNCGTIRCSEGDLFLLGAQIENEGSLIAPNGCVGLGSASAILLQPDASKKIYIRAEAPSSRIEQKGTIEALSTEIAMYGPFHAALRISGKIGAFDVENEGGRVFITAPRSRVSVEGEIIAPGGEVAIVGKEVFLEPTAEIDISSAKQAGKVAIGAGMDFPFPEAESVWIGEGARIKADHTAEGKGGSVLINSMRHTHFAGTITATGGEGGFVEVSGLDKLCYRGTSDLRGTVLGTLLLDPRDLTVTAGGGALMDNLFCDMPGVDVTITGAAVGAALDLGNVDLQANRDVIIDDAITQTVGSGDLNLAAVNAITFTSSGTITMAGRNVTASINDVGSGACSGSQIGGSASFVMPVSSFIATNGGNVTVSVGNFMSIQEGFVSLTGGQILAGGGNIDMTGINVAGVGSQAHGISLTTTGITSSVVSTTGSGTITLTGTGGTQTGGQCHGVNIADATTAVSSVDGQITITGLGGSASDANFGVAVGNGALVSASGTGGVTAFGTGGGGVNSNYGVHLADSLSVSTNSGNIDLTGTSNGVGTNNTGVMIESAGAASSTSGTIAITGTGGQQTVPGPPGSAGVRVTGGSSVTSGGSVQIQGTGGSGTGGFCSGIETSGPVQSTGGSLSLDGTGGNGTDFCVGVFIGGPVTIDSDNELLSVTGTGGAMATSTFNPGIVLIGGTVSSTSVNPGASPISMTGIGGGGTGSATGIVLQMGATVQTMASSISLEGTGGNASGTQNGGIVAGGSTISAGGSGQLLIDGTGGPGTGVSQGVYISGGTTVSTASGLLQVIGSAGSATDEAILIDSAGTIQSAAGAIDVQALNGSCVLDGEAAIDATVGPISIASATSIDLSAGPLGTDNPVIRITNGASSAAALLIAGTNVTLASVAGGGTAEISNAGSGDVTLVCDNLFPSRPNSGSGGFSISSILSANGELRIYTSAPQFNVIQDPINGQAFVPGPFGIDSATERWETYYPFGAYGGAAFNLYYKTGFGLNVIFAKLLIAQAQMGDSLPILYLHYYLQFCYENAQRARQCNPNLDKIYLRKPFYRS